MLPVFLSPGVSYVLYHIGSRRSTGLLVWYTGVIREECQLLSIRNVAKHILGGRETGISTMKLHKLCYFIQGWHLAINGERMFPEGFEAWDYGPVSAELEEIFRSRSYISRDDEGFAAVVDNLTDYQKYFVDTILEIYDQYAALQLADMVRNHRAWIEAYEEGFKVKISQDAIAREFSDMLLHIPK